VRDPELGQDNAELIGIGFDNWPEFGFHAAVWVLGIAHVIRMALDLCSKLIGG